MRAYASIGLLSLAVLAGCRHTAAPPRPGLVTTGLDNPAPMATLQTIVTPPAGWLASPLETGPRHRQQVWVSPTGNTAYGVIHTSMPLPVGPDLALVGFLREMKRAEGESILVEKHLDHDAAALRFIAEGGKYRIRAILRTRGWHAWVVFAGTLRDHPIDDGELLLAERAREATRIGMPQ